MSTGAASRFSKVRDFKDAVWDAKDHVLEVASPHALSRAAGYLKFADNAGGGVYFRGQTKIYPQTPPSLYRKSNTNKTNQEQKLNAYLKTAVSAKAFLPSTPEYAREPLLQHYGIRTRWLDLVDNVWTALWFACHEAEVAGTRLQYLHLVPSPEPYAYVVLVQAGAEHPVVDCPGLWESDKAMLIDLRRAAPSLYLRPHAQHGLLLRRKSYIDNGSMDLSDMVVGVIRIKRTLALSWLGTGLLTTVHHVFPPPLYDYGYKRFLEEAPSGDRYVGTIHHVGA